MIAYIIPLIDIMRYLRLDDTFVGVTLALTAVYTPLAMYVLYSYLAHISPERNPHCSRILPKPLERVAQVVGQAPARDCVEPELDRRLVIGGGVGVE